MATELSSLKRKMSSVKARLTIFDKFVQKVIDAWEQEIDEIQITELKQRCDKAEQI